MNSKELINQEYAELCRQLGHLLNNKDKIEDQLISLKNQISALDLAGAALDRLDNEKAKLEMQNMMAAQKEDNSDG